MTKAPLLLLALTLITAAEPLKIMVIGDSQSEEYRFEVPFSAPASDPLDANTMNWIEILSAHRAGDVSFGEYRSNLFSYPDVRNGGYEFNWSIPGALTETWVDVLNSTIFENPGFLTSRINLLEQLDEVEVVVIFLGGNDMNNVYNRLTKDNPPPNWPGDVLDQVDEIVEKIRTQNSTIPIIIGTFPDVGGTQKRQLDFPDKIGRDRASGYIAEANLELQAYATDEGFPVFDVAAFTRDLIDEAPYRIANVEFFPFGDPENKPRHLLCRDGFHPATSSQAIIANGIIAALNEATGSTIAILSEEEIVVDVLGLPLGLDDSYLAWATDFSLLDDSLLADPDGDGVSNLGEYALDTDPSLPDAPEMDREGNFGFQTKPSRTDYVVTRAEGSKDLVEWFLISQNLPGDLERLFFRLGFSLPQ